MATLLIPWYAAWQLISSHPFLMQQCKPQRPATKQAGLTWCWSVMEGFSPKSLKARHAVLAGTPGNVSIQILMAPFLENQEIVDASIHLDGIDLPSSMLKDLAGKSFEFPVNPHDGYIDGSIYLDNAHHPVDVTSLSFSRSRDGQLKLIVQGIYVFDFEGLNDLGNIPFTLATVVSSCAV